MGSMAFLVLSVQRIAEARRSKVSAFGSNQKRNPNFWENLPGSFYTGFKNLNQDSVVIRELETD